MAKAVRGDGTPHVRLAPAACAAWGALLAQLLPQPRRRLVDESSGVRGDAIDHVAQIGARIDPVRLAGIQLPAKDRRLLEPRGHVPSAKYEENDSRNTAA